MAESIRRSILTTPIQAGQSQSAEIDTGAFTLVGLATDANWTGSQISFLVSVDGVNFYTLTNAAGNLTFGAIAARTYLAIDPTLFRGVTACKVVSATQQASSTVLTLIARHVA